MAKERRILVAMLVGAIVMLPGCTGSGAGTTYVTAEAEHTLTVSATAEVQVVPDRASIQVAVTTQGSTAEEAEAANAELVGSVLSALADQGVGEESVQTRWTNLSPLYGIAEDEAIVEGEAFGEDMATIGWLGYGNDITGYEMTTSLSVSDLEIEEVGAVMEAAIAAGANEISGISYYSSTYDEAYAEALDDAISQAGSKAETMAESAGVTLGAPASITEGYQNRYYAYEEAVTMDSADAGSRSYDVAPGTISIEASVTVSYVIE